LQERSLMLLKLAEILAVIFPAGVVNIATGCGESVGAPMVSHDRVRMVV
jgi:aminobutyraldehyde dehydrogenase